MKTIFSFGPYGTFTSMEKKFKKFYMCRLLDHCVDRVVAITIRPLLAACQRRGGLVAVLATGLLEAVDRERHQGGSVRGQQLAVSTVLFFCVERKIFNFYRIPT